MLRSIPINKKQHATSLAVLLVQIQDRISNIKSIDPLNLAAIGDANILALNILALLRLREYNTFLIEQDIIKKEDVEALLNKFATFQTEIVELTKQEIVNIYDKAQEQAEEALSERLLSNYKPDEKIH